LRLLSIVYNENSEMRLRRREKKSRSLHFVAGAPESGAEEKTGHSGRDDEEAGALSV
jgi:hypothetical protein